MFDRPKRETDVREWLVFAIDSLHTSNREVSLSYFRSPHVGLSPQDDIARGAVVHGNRSLLPLVVGVPYSNCVAVQLLYEGNDEKM